MTIKTLCFNPFSENTYLVLSGGEAVIIDPGCFDSSEEEALIEAIGSHALKAVWLTHSHLDHVLGLPFVYKEFGIKPLLHKEDVFTWNLYEKSAAVWSIPIRGALPPMGGFFEHKQQLSVGEEIFEVRFTPGHASGHVVFVNHAQKKVLAGDVLFAGSIGRTDLPGGDFSVLESSIRNQLYTLPDDYTVYPGHGPTTEIGLEKRGNPFLSM
jgi:glyoxylase-like metal-dependent hydrolase (beta-lactamase superfamily II)